MTLVVFNNELEEIFIKRYKMSRQRNMGVILLGRRRPYQTKTRAHSTTDTTFTTHTGLDVS